MRKDILFTVAGNLTTVANTALNLGTIIRRYGCSINANGSTANISKPGYNKVSVSAVVSNSTSAAVTLTLNATQNSANIVGATGTVTIGAGETETVTFSGVTRSYCNGSAIQVVPNTSGVTIDTLGVIVEEV